MKKLPLFDQLQEHINKFSAKQATIEQLEPIIMELGESFNDMLHELWKGLMTIEMQLFEQCEVSCYCLILVTPLTMLTTTFFML